MSIGHEPAVCLGTTNTFKYKPAPPIDGSMAPLANSSSTPSQPGKKNHPHHVGKVEGSDDYAKLPELYAPPYRWNGWGTAG